MLNLCTKKQKMRKQYNGEFETPNFLQVRKKEKRKKGMGRLELFTFQSP
jgi:hypothetical protein